LKSSFKFTSSQRLRKVLRRKNYFNFKTKNGLLSWCRNQLAQQKLSVRGGFGARVFCGAEQFCRRSAKLSNIPCQLPAKLEMKFPFPVSARDVDFN
jgi:hypothetical protein